MQYNKFTDDNDVFGFSSPDQYEYYDIKQIYRDFTINNDSNQLLSFKIYVSSEKKNIIREVYTVSQMLADIGGFIELIRFTFYFFISSFSMKRLMAYIINRMYFKDRVVPQKLDNRRVHNMSESTVKSIRNDTYASSDVSVPGISLSRSFDQNYDI